MYSKIITVLGSILAMTGGFEFGRGMILDDAANVFAALLIVPMAFVVLYMGYKMKKEGL